MENKFGYIDSLRGIAVLMVVLVHVGQTVSGLNPAIEFFTRYGQLGVQLFFLVSGFTLCLSMDRRSLEDNATAKFYIRRYFRIAPLYYFGIAWFFVIRLVQESLPAQSLVFPMRFDFTNVAANITLTHGFVPSANNSIVPGGWSIGTEMAFYLVFPLLFVLTRKIAETKIRKLIYFAFAVLLVSLFIQGPETFYDMDNGSASFMYYNITNQMPVFLIGITSYEFYKRGLLDRVPSWLAFLSLLVSIAVAAYLWLGEVAFSVTLVPFFAGLSFVFLLVTFSRSQYLNGALIRHIGQLSFSIYLSHFVFARVLGRAFENLHVFNVPSEFILVMHFFLTASVSYVVAIWTEKHIEQRGIAAGRFLILWLYGQQNKSIKVAAS